ncbi:MAG: Asp23/Gls24 family envelope stress response protein [Phascolarctobacterium sp.]|mgnify:CR=1 FL=1|nr:Asp23/Gls24 family envelope stress response protein [Phascolarctobacterium sp.]
MDEKYEKTNKFSDIDAQTDDFEEMGDIHIADDVIGIVASLACQEVPGVIGMAGGITDGLNSLIGKENASKGIRLKFDNKTVTANVYVIVEYGYNIPEIALAIQERVKEAIEVMTKFEVQFVDVHIEGVQRRKITELEKESGAEENMADIVTAQTMHAEATEANSFEAQLALHRDMEEEEAREFALNEETIDEEMQTKSLEDTPDDELTEEELAIKYHYKPTKMFETDEDLEARHNKFFEED